MGWFWSSLHLFEFISLGLTSILGFLIIRFVFNRFSKNSIIWTKIYRSLNFLIPSFLFIYIWLGIYWFSKEDSWERPLAIILLASASFVLGLHYFRDLFYGLMLRGEGTLNKGSRVTIFGKTGRVKRTELRSIVLEQDDGTEIRINYNKVARSIISLEADKNHIQGRGIEFPITEDADAWKLSKKIQQMAIYHPYTLTANWPEVQIEQKDSSRFLRLIVDTPGPEFSLTLERDLRQKLNTDN